MTKAELWAWAEARPHLYVAGAVKDLFRELAEATAKIAAHDKEVRDEADRLAELRRASAGGP